MISRSAMFSAVIILSSIGFCHSSDVTNPFAIIFKSDQRKNLQICAFKVVRETIKQKGFFDDNYISVGILLRCSDAMDKFLQIGDYHFLAHAMIGDAFLARKLYIEKGPSQFDHYDMFNYSGKLID